MQSAATAAAGEHQSGAYAGDNAAQQTAGEHIVHKGLGRDGDDTEEDGICGGDNEGIAGEDLAQRAVSQQQQGNIEGIENQSRNIETEGVHPQQHQDCRTDQLAEAHHAAGNETQGDNKEIDAQGINQCA